MICAIDFLQENDLSKEELLENCEIINTKNSDLVEIAVLLSKSFNVNSDIDVLKQMLYANIDLETSVKVIDKRDNKIYGFLLFAQSSLTHNTPIYEMFNNDIISYLETLKMINGFAFIIDKRLRGENFDKKMLEYSQSFIQNYDLIWCGVDNHLKSHKYWEKIGFIEIFHDEYVTFYVKKINNNDNDIFIIKILKMLYEKNTSIRKQGIELN